MKNKINDHYFYNKVYLHSCNQSTRKYIVRVMVIQFSCLRVLVLNPYFISFFKQHLQGLSSKWICSRCRVQCRQGVAILHDIKVDSIAWAAHEATGDCVDTLMRRGKYPRGFVIGPTDIGEHCVILYNLFAAKCCFLRQQCRKCNSLIFAC